MRSRLTTYTLAAAIVCIGTSVSGIAQADLSLTFVGGPNGSGCGGGGGGCGGTIPIAPGGQALYELIVRNNGPVAAANIVVTITFPPKISINPPAPSTPLSCSSSVVNGNPTLTCTQMTLASGDTSAIAILINLASDYPWQNGLSATASVTSSPSDPNMSNNSVTVNLAVEPPTAIPLLDGRSLMLLVAMLAIVGLVAMSRASA